MGQPRYLAFAVGVRKHLAERVVGEGLNAAIGMVDAQHFAVGFAFQRGGVVQGIGDGDQMTAIVIAVISIFA
ncbi:hypothetical protein ALQ55_200119 [Pseudomonas savastanoi pv. savastanoi]|nr:hypothetical protein ALQ55_200119 [Pseudomonas savastanoi pv. savastanoi]